MTDVLLLVPFEPVSARLIDPMYRQSIGAYLGMPLVTAMSDLEEYVGRPLNFNKPLNRPFFGGKRLNFPSHRTLTAVAIATALERSQISWKAIDPGPWELRQWRKRLQKEQREPVVVGVSTIYVMSAPWLNRLCAMIRQIFKNAKIVVGGYYYATNTTAFLSLDADVFFLGRCEDRFSKVVRALKRGETLESILGLCIKRPDGSIKYTGKFTENEVYDSDLPDWRLAKKIEPPVNLEHDEIEFSVETQRGCPFACEFCSYRSMAAYRAYTIEQAVEAICNTSLSVKGCINIVDSTATFPRKRWINMLEALAQRGGAPHPIGAYARVSDISEKSAAIMAQAGIHTVFIGQESGDQTTLDMMKKGTRVEQVPEAIQWLGKYDIGAAFGFMHGFPGETQDSIIATRNMICNLNKNHKTKPVVLSCFLTPFFYYDFASVSTYSSMQNVSHFLGYDQADITPRRASEEVLTTMIAASRISHAPMFGYLLLGASPPTSGITIFSSPYRQEIFHWLKAVERGMTIFLEKNLDGKRIDDIELRSIKKAILGRYEQGMSLFQKQFAVFSSKIMKTLYGRMTTEWKAEARNSMGWFTRTLLSILMDDKKMFFEGIKATKSGQIQDGGKAAYVKCDRAGYHVEELAEIIKREVMVRQ